MEQNSNEVKKRKFFSWKNILIFLAFEVIFVGITAPLVIFYGPFSNLKRTIVGTAMSSRTKQGIARIFLSDDQINEILKPKEQASAAPSGEASSSNEQNLNDIKVQNTHDDTIERYEIKGKKSNGYLLVVKDPTRVKVAYTKKLGVEGERTSDMAKDHNAVAAINGGSFTDKSADGKLWAGTGGLPGGILMVDGKLVYPTENINYDEKIKDVVGINKKGVLIVGQKSIRELQQNEVMEAVSFSPTLIINGKPQYDYQDQGITARTAIGQRKEDGAILLLVMDGRQAKSLGATIEEVQKIMMDQHAWNAINLDGGSSTTMYLEGEVINNPCDPLGERTVATSIYVRP